MAETLPAHSPRGLRFEHIWLLLALAVVGGFVSIMPTVPHDFFWHVRAGQVIDQTRAVPATNLFAWTLPPETPFTYQSWLGEWLLYRLYALGGWPLVIFARNALALVAFSIIGLEAARRSGSFMLAAVLVLLAGAMSTNVLTCRTQNFSWVPFALTLVVLLRVAEGSLRTAWLIVLPVIMLFWVNAHGAFTLGLLMTLAFAGGSLLERFGLGDAEGTAAKRLPWFWATLVLMVAASFVNPLGPRVYSYVLAMLRDQPSQELVDEWQPPIPTTLAESTFVVCVLLLLAVLALARRRPSVGEVVLLLGLGWMAFHGRRYVIWFGFAAVLVMARCLRREASASPTEASGPRQENRTFNAVIAGLLALSWLALQPWFKPYLPLPADYRSQFADMPGAPLLFSGDTPVAAVEHLKASPPAGPLFNDMGAGSYIAWAAPNIKVFVDPRVEQFPMELWNDYRRISQDRDLPATLEKHHIAVVLLSVQSQPRLSSALAALPGWACTYKDPQNEVWRRSP